MLRFPADRETKGLHRLPRVPAAGKFEAPDGRVVCGHGYQRVVPDDVAQAEEHRPLRPFEVECFKNCLEVCPYGPTVGVA